jgi:prepilin-type N-terminal cleavage/methylation domain-containing protein/prepilin-type processing-associated H-X9-DG protein
MEGPILDFGFWILDFGLASKGLRPSKSSPKTSIQNPKSKIQNAFTLIELLVVIAIFAILAAVLFPVLARARSRAMQTTCQSNLKQIGQGFTAYLNDYDETYPANETDPFLWQGRHWRWPVRTYLGYSGQIGTDDKGQKTILVAEHPGANILACPADPAETYDATSYAYSAAFYHSPDQVEQMTAPADLYSAAPDKFPVEPQSQGDVKSPAQKIMVGEWASNHYPLGDSDPGWWGWTGTRVYLFADGHVKTLKASLLHPGANTFPDPNVTVGGVGGKDVE